MLKRIVLLTALIIGCAEDAPEPVDVEGQLGPALVSSSLGKDGTLSLTFSKPVAWVTVDGVIATLTNNATRASADVESGVLDVAWTGRGGGAFYELLVFSDDATVMSDDATVMPPDGSMAFLPVMPRGSIVMGGMLFDVEPFYIAKHETTNAQYEAFVQAADGFDNAAWWSDMPAGYRPPQRGLKTQGNSLLDAPRDEVSWYQAVAFTRWLNARMQAKNADISAGGLLVNGVEWEVRLPAEWEWHWAAQSGAEERDYPWGNWREGRANTTEARVGAAKAVGSYPLGAAACGALDMSGNVYEWCLNKWEPPYSTTVDTTDELRVLRGGSFLRHRVFAASSVRVDYLPDGTGSDGGFRVGLFSPL